MSLESIYVEVNQLPFGLININLNYLEMNEEKFKKRMSIKFNFEEYEKTEIK